MNGSLASAASGGGGSSAIGNSSGPYFSHNRYASPESAMSPSISSVATSTSEVSEIFLLKKKIVLKITVSGVVLVACLIYYHDYKIIYQKRSSETV